MGIIFPLLLAAWLFMAEVPFLEAAEIDSVSHGHAKKNNHVRGPSPIFYPKFCENGNTHSSVSSPIQYMKIRRFG